MSKIIENHAKVYLHRDVEGQWEVDAVTLDGYPLDGLDGGDAVGEGWLDGEDTPEAEYEAAIAAARADANRVDVPNGLELAHLLANAAGFRLVPLGGTA